jgi:protein TonB
VVHVIAWQVLVHGLNWVNAMPVLKAVEVQLVNDEAPPPPPPAVPKVEQSVKTEVFVPTPEVKVTQESPMLVAATPVPPPARVTSVETPTASTAVYSPSPIMVTESDVDYLVRPDIRYPHASRRDKEHGLVLLSVIVNTRGLVENVNVFKSSGFARLDECATRAMRSMRVKPYVRNGIAMAIELRIPVEFS